MEALVFLSGVFYQMAIDQYTSYDDIYSVLIYYSNTFESLKNHEGLISDLAKKYSEHGCFLVINEDGISNGFTAFYLNDETKTAYISLIATNKNSRRQGYGKRLINELIRVSIDNGMEKIKLEVRKKNLNAIEFYRSQDFDILDSKNEESYYMQKII